ncbi:HupE/UreJ family protein [Sphingopyxis bauzanensis]|uniref:HupE/UreJ family protein n=1 Tax=Sphingopyxis bauzanensis TaxID=651663 RepID=UPI0013031CE7|nr:HupE/UreJ family protein [Sphingopyxis bauzanensis]
MHAVAVLTPPSGASPRNLVAEWHAVVDELPSHFALFVIRRDIAGVSGAEPQIVGAVRSGGARIVIDVGDASKWREFRNTVKLGIDHIIGGYDHLMFLLALLLPAPLAARAGRWATVCDWRSSVRRIVSVVTAFTIGHSLTLIGATIGGWSLPVQPVEIAISVSVLISAAHAVRPIFPGYEAVVAGIFGLIHGLAFATLIAGLDLGGTAAPLALLGFSLGIELVQLAIVLIGMPTLLLLAPYPSYRQIRIGLAVVGMAAAVAWLLERAFGIGSVFVALLENTIIAVAIAVVIMSFLIVANQLFWRQFSRLGSAT